MERRTFLKALVAVPIALQLPQPEIPWAGWKPIIEPLNYVKVEIQDYWKRLASWKYYHERIQIYPDGSRRLLKAEMIEYSPPDALRALKKFEP